MIARISAHCVVSHQQRLLRKGLSASRNRASTCIRVRSSDITRSFADLTIKTDAMNQFMRNQRWQQYACQRLPFSTSSPDRLFPEELNILYDSKCNVCKLEMDFLAKRDASRATKASRPRKIKLTDLEDESFNPNDPANGGVTYAKAMASMHAIKPDGQVVEGVAVFSVAYDLVGLGWLFRFTEWPIAKPIVQWGYDVFAIYRTSVTRGSSLESLVEAYEARQASKQPPQDCVTCKSPVSDKL